MKPEEIQEEAQKLSDRELLVKTYGDIREIKGVLGDGGGLINDVRHLKKVAVTRGELMLTVGIISVVAVGMGLLLHFTG